MTPAPLPPLEEERLSQLRDYQILDTPPEQAFDDVVELAALVCGTPVALVTLVDETRQWFKARRGLTMTSTPRDLSFCAHTILGNALLEIQDTLADERFADHPFVLGEPHVRFYAGAPLISPRGHRLGSVCVIDYRPRVLEPAQRHALQALARLVVLHLELRRPVEPIEPPTLHSEGRFRALVEASAHIIWKTAADGGAFEDSPSWRAFTGQTFEQSRGLGWLDALHPDDRRTVADEWRRAVAANEPFTCDYRVRHVSGEWRWLAVRAVALSDSNGAHGWVGMNTDITEHRRQSEALTHQASHDALTGLVNRAEFERRVRRVLTSAEIRDTHVLLFLDLDRFKQVNDTCGHAAGDTLLRQVADVLGSPLRGRDTLARLGGDEFGILLERCSQENGLQIAEQLVEAVRGYRFLWEDSLFALGVSIGLVAVPAAGHGLAEVMGTADRACYVAKQMGRNRVHVYAASDEDLMRRQGERLWVPRLQQALADDRFRLYAQPVVALKDRNDQGRAIEYQELLLRLIDEHGDVLVPAAFLPAAERHQQMRALDRWVVRTALAHAAACEPPVRCGINLAAASLREPSFPGFVLEQLDAAAVDPGNICFEITEAAALADLQQTLRFMQALKARGCCFALDDFGSGLASFSDLKVLPVDYVKIDGQFVQQVASDRFDGAVVQAMQQIAQSLGLQTIAEGVESAEALERVAALGVDFAQGLAIGEPKPIFHSLDARPLRG